jgi:hypothetical protein
MIRLLLLYIMVELAHHALHHNALSSYWLIYPIGHVYVDPEPEVQAKQAQVKASTNLDLDQGKPRCI